MITKQSDKKLQQSRNFESHSFGIKESGLSHIFNVLRNQLYSDKVLAVIREYSTNAVDAHIEAGKNDLPIRVTLPNQLNSEFKVRDFGRGLTEEQISQVYAMYGESTKRGTNEQIGQLGLGCKSAFAYGDNFIINSFVNGVKTTYNAFIDPSDIGQISKMQQSDTDEQDGIEIVIPVKSDDVNEFHSKAFRLFKFFKVVPEILGADNSTVEEKTKKSKVIIAKDNWKLVDGDSYAIMGNIAYPIDAGALNLSWQEPLYELISSGVEIVFNIGDLEISASREALQYTEATKKSMMTTLQSIIDALPDVLGEKFNECKTLWEAKVLYNKAFAHGGFGGKIKKIVDNKGIKWNGIIVKSGHFDNSKWKQEDIEVKAFTKPHQTYGRGAKRVRGNESNNIYCSDDALVIIDDLPTHHGRLNRIAPLIESYEKETDPKKYKTVYLINYRSSKAKTEYLDSRKLDFPAKKLSEYPKVILRDIYPSNSTVSGGTTTSKNSKHSTKVFSLDKECRHGSYHTCRSDFFESNEVDLEDGGVYVIVNKFYWGSCETEERHPHSLVKKVDALIKCDVDVPEIYALKPTEKNLKAVENKNWVFFDDWARETLACTIGEYGLVGDMFCKVVAEHHTKVVSRNRDDKWDETLLELNDTENPEKFFDKLPESSTAKTYLKSYNDMIAKGNEQISNFYEAFMTIGKASKIDERHYGWDAKERDLDKMERKADMRGILDYCWGEEYDWLHGSEFDLCAMNKECQKRYPMLDLLDSSHFRYSSKQDRVAKETSNYITMIEATYNIKGRLKKKIAEKIINTTNKDSFSSQLVVENA